MRPEACDKLIVTSYVDAGEIRCPHVDGVHWPREEDSERSRAWVEIESPLSQFDSKAGFQCPGEVIVCGGKAP